MSQDFESVEQAWNFIWGPDSKARRNELDLQFRKFFPSGHLTSIRELVQKCASGELFDRFGEQPNAKFLRNFHPRSFALLAEHGRHYRPYVWKRMPAFGDVVQNGTCYATSRTIMLDYNRDVETSDLKKLKDRPRFVYVEGLAMGMLCLPMLHAWNAFGLSGRLCLDASHSAGCKWTCYFGVAVTQDEYLEIRARASVGTVLSLFHVETFERVEPLLRKVIESRSH